MHELHMFLHKNWNSKVAERFFAAHRENGVISGKRRHTKTKWWWGGGGSLKPLMKSMIEHTGFHRKYGTAAATLGPVCHSLVATTTGPAASHMNKLKQLQKLAQVYNFNTMSRVQNQ